MGAEAVRKLLMNLDLVKLSDELRAELVKTNSKQKRKDLINRLKFVESIRDSENKPEWMVLDCDSGDSAGSASAGFVGLRQFRDQRFERSLSPNHQSQQSSCANWSI